MLQSLIWYCYKVSFGIVTVSFGIVAVSFGIVAVSFGIVTVSFGIVTKSHLVLLQSLIWKCNNREKEDMIKVTISEHILCHLRHIYLINQIMMAPVSPTKG